MSVTVALILSAATAVFGHPILRDLEAAKQSNPYAGWEHIIPYTPENLTYPGACPSAGQLKKPVMLIAAMTGTQIDATLKDKRDKPHFFCESNAATPFRIWGPSVQWGIPGASDCIEDNLRVVATVATPARGDAPPVMAYNSPQGVATSIPYDDLRGTLTVGSTAGKVGWRYGYLLGLMLQKFGYTADCDVQGVAYDWRVGGDSFSAATAVVNATGDTGAPVHDDVFGRIATTTERLSRQTGRRVALVGLSMGGPMISSFLASRSAAWKKRFVSGFASMSGAFGGSPESMHTMAFQPSSFLWYKKKATAVSPTFAGAVRSLPGSMWMAPTPALYADSPIITTHRGTTRYTASNITQLLERLPVAAAAASSPVGDVQSSETLTAMYQSVAPSYAAAQQPPGVPVYCTYGANLTTPGTLHFPGDLFSANATMSYVTGDQVIPEKSLAVCSRWRDAQSEPVVSVVIPGNVHGTELANYTLVTDVLQWIGHLDAAVPTAL